MSPFVTPLQLTQQTIIIVHFAYYTTFNTLYFFPVPPSAVTPMLSYFTLSTLRAAARKSLSQGSIAIYVRLYSGGGECLFDEVKKTLSHPLIKRN